MPIPVDPVLPDDFDNRPNELRSKAELDAWWDKPYAVTLSDGRVAVRCLHGGAWDRSSMLGIASSIEEAEEIATQQLEAWQKTRSTPVVAMLGGGKFGVMRMAQRPDQHPQILQRATTLEKAWAALDTLLTHGPRP